MEEEHDFTEPENNKRKTMLSSGERSVTMKNQFILS